MKNIIRIQTQIIVSAILFSLPFAIRADTLILKDGRVLQGKFKGGTQNWIQFDVNNELQEISVSTITTLTFTPMPQADTPPPPPAQQATAPPPAPAQGRFTIPAGTRLLVRNDETLVTGTAKTGDRITYTFEAGLMINKTMVITPGSKAYGRVVEERGAKRLAGKARIVIEVTDITIGDRVIPIVSDMFGYEGQGTGADTATKIGAGAAIGGVLDGKEGAGKGAAVGGAVALMTKGQQVQIKSGTLLEFRMQQPLTVQLP